jgi:outer membrane protein TolC
MHEREAVERGIRSARSIYDWSEQIAEELKVDLWQVEVGTYTDALDSRLDLSAAQFDKIELDDHTEAEVCHYKAAGRDDLPVYHIFRFITESEGGSIDIDDPEVGEEECAE